MATDSNLHNLTDTQIQDTISDLMRIAMAYVGGKNPALCGKYLKERRRVFDHLLDRCNYTDLKKGHAIFKAHADELGYALQIADKLPLNFEGVNYESVDKQVAEYLVYLEDQEIIKERLRAKRKI